MATAPRSRARGEGFICATCEATSLRWAGRCPACGEWNTLGPAPARSEQGRPSKERRGPPALALADVSTDGTQPLPTGVSELDRVMGGGVVAGSVTLLFGPPGIGKSTLLFQVLSSLAATGPRRHAGLGRGVAGPGPGPRLAHRPGAAESPGHRGP